MRFPICCSSPPPSFDSPDALGQAVGQNPDILTDGTKVKVQGRIYCIDSGGHAREKQCFLTRLWHHCFGDRQAQRREDEITGVLQRVLAAGQAAGVGVVGDGSSIGGDDSQSGGDHSGQPSPAPAPPPPPPPPPPPSDSLGITEQQPTVTPLDQLKKIRSLNASIAAMYGRAHAQTTGLFSAIRAQLSEAGISVERSAELNGIKERLIAAFNELGDVYARAVSVSQEAETHYDYEEFDELGSALAQMTQLAERAEAEMAVISEIAKELGENEAQGGAADDSQELDGAWSQRF